MEVNKDREKFAHFEDKEQPTDNFEILEKWLLENNSKFPKLELKEYDEEIRGVHTKSEIDPDEVIVEIPLKCLITVEMGKDTPIGRAVLASGLILDAPKHIFLMLFMLSDRKSPSSFFKPYYDTLPPTLSNMPIFWSQEELAHLTGSYILTQIDERKMAIESDYMNICDIAPELADIATLEEFKWARMCVCSRNFGLEINGTRTAALVPYADMLNHYRPRETKWTFDHSRQGFTITTLQQIISGAQIYDSYGQKCNHRFLLNYGFAIENNREADGFCPNECPLEFFLKEDDMMYVKKLPCWSRDGMPKIKRIRLCVSDNENFRCAFSLLRVIVASEDEFVGMVGHSMGSGMNMYKSARDITYPVSLRNEEAALKLLLQMVETQLAKYPNSIEDDAKALKSESIKPFSNHRHAIIQIKGEKEVLLEYQSLCVIGIELLNLDNIEFQKRVNDLFNEGKYFVANYSTDFLFKIRQEEAIKKEQIRNQSGIDLTYPTVV